MGLFDRLLGRKADEPDLTPLWHRVVELAREPHWYAERGVADTVAGRFDCITMVLALVLLRMEQDEALRGLTARLTERFVADMDGQLRQNGVGDLVVGKHIGRLMESLGGRLGAYRTALADAGDEALIQAVGRNVSLNDGADPAIVAAGLRTLAASLQEATAADLIAGRIRQ